MDRLPPKLAFGLRIGTGPGLRHHDDQVLAGNEPSQPARHPAGRLCAKRGGERRQFGDLHGMPYRSSVETIRDKRLAAELADDTRLLWIACCPEDLMARCGQLRKKASAYGAGRAG
jgi:hypothetical protein